MESPPSPISERLEAALRCPACLSTLHVAEGELLCAEGCGGTYPRHEGVPILLSPASLFSASDCASGRRNSADRSSLAMRALDLSPSLHVNRNAKRNYERFRDGLIARSERPSVLVIGGGELGASAEVVLSDPRVEATETDVAPGSRTQIICDAHELPFADDSFDGVIVQAVLDDVVDPHRCVAEIHRVLAPSGLVYAETPFMQPVHDGAYDFTRFTHLGHRALFRGFDEVESGAVAGPAIALALQYRALLKCVAPGKVGRAGAALVANLTAFWLKYIDQLLVGRPGALDCSTGCFFLGSKSERALTDRELMGLYRGASQTRPVPALPLESSGA